MEEISHTSTAARIELTAPELGLLSDLLEQILGYQEAPSDALDRESREAYDALRLGFSAALRGIWEEERLRGAPFGVGERVVVTPDRDDAIGSGLSEPASAVILDQHPPDARHDYEWLRVRLDDGRELELPPYQLRRSDLQR